MCPGIIIRKIGSYCVVENKSIFIQRDLLQRPKVYSGYGLLVRSPKMTPVKMTKCLATGTCYDYDLEVSGQPDLLDLLHRLCHSPTPRKDSIYEALLIGFWKNWNCTQLQFGVCHSFVALNFSLEFVKVLFICLSLHVCLSHKGHTTWRSCHSGHRPNERNVTMTTQRAGNQSSDVTAGSVLAANIHGEK